MLPRSFRELPRTSVLNKSLINTHKKYKQHAAFPLSSPLLFPSVIEGVSVCTYVGKYLSGGHLGELGANMVQLGHFSKVMKLIEVMCLKGKAFLQ